MVDVVSWSMWSLFVGTVDKQCRSSPGWSSSARQHLHWGWKNPFEFFFFFFNGQVV